SPATAYREEQLFGWWVYALLLAMAAIGATVAVHRAQDGGGLAAASALQMPLAVAVGAFLPIVLTVGVLRMTTEVVPGEVRVWFGWVPSYRRRIALEGVRRVEVVRYRPVIDHLGWGVRRGRDGERALTARGNRGVRLHFADGGRLVIGSQRPEALA